MVRGVRGPPRQVGLLVREEELRGPVADLREHLHREGVRTPEETRHKSAAQGVLGAEPGHMAPLGLAVLVGDAKGHDAETRIGGVQVPYLAEDVGVDEQTVVVQLDDDVHVAELPQLPQRYVPAARAAEVLVELDGRDLAGEAGELGQRAAVPHDDDSGKREVLLGHRDQQRFDLRGPVPHGHHGDSDPRFDRHNAHPTHSTTGTMLAVNGKDVLSTP